MPEHFPPPPSHLHGVQHLREAFSSAGTIMERTHLFLSFSFLCPFLYPKQHFVSDALGETGLFLTCTFMDVAELKQDLEANRAAGTPKRFWGKGLLSALFRTNASRICSYFRSCLGTNTTLFSCATLKKGTAGPSNRFSISQRQAERETKFAVLHKLFIPLPGSLAPSSL